MSGMIFPFSFSTTKIIINLLSVKSSSGSWGSDESDEFFSNRFVKKYLDISNRIEIVLSVFEFSGVSDVLFQFSFSTTQSISKLLPVKVSSSSWVSDESDEFF